MSDSTNAPKAAEAKAPRPKGWLARAFGLGESKAEVVPPRPFDFNAMHHALTSLERKSTAGE